MKRRKIKNSLSFVVFSKFFLLFIIFLAILLLPKSNIVKERLFPKNYLESENVTEIKANIKSNLNATPTHQPAFNWSVEKVDDHLTRISIPPDPRMSTSNELFDAMNAYRSSHNVQTLQKNDFLCSVAQNRASEQQVNGDLDGHAGFSKYFENQNEFNKVGEVLFGGDQPQYGVHIIEYGWDRSLTGHKEAIGDPDWNYGCAGIAGYYAVFIFGRK